jgi:spore germination protein YaaH
MKVKYGLPAEEPERRKQRNRTVDSSTGRRTASFIQNTMVFFFSLSLCACPSAPPPAPETGIPVFPGGAEEFPEELLPPPGEELPRSSFTEIWGYLVSGREQALREGLPLSDIGYFGAEVDSYGQLTGTPDQKRIASFPGRKHLVVACNSRGLTHFVLEPGSRVRKELIADLLGAVKLYDGLQIDFELVPPRDGDNFRSFLEELRDRLGEKIFSVALPARTKTLENDVYDYQKIAPLVDRILVMAYDEHWSTSAPGPIASLGWCRSVAAYALAAVGREKLIMGLPFYGRTWGNVNPGRAFFHSGIEQIIDENKVTEIRRENGIPTFTYEVPLTITAYYEDAYSLSARLIMYQTMGVTSAGFWSLGQETPVIWDLLELTPEDTP